MTNDEFNTELGSMECSSDIASSNDEYGSNSPKALRKAEINNRRRLDDLLEYKRLRQELDDYDEYLGNGHYDDDVISHYYSREVDE